ncbi:uncharacterized protein LOC143488914 [Brachyhypopomus gauderio]|uniref:uncharacterized protein LOC143488914 n=1 Tax=Brachyhypopomus gauderio TaxID=698409 RepID=UPI004042AEA6
MNYMEKGHKAGMKHLTNQDSLMDETDREVMNLTDRAFKSLCIGDEAVYNDAEFSPSPVSCRKPLAEEIPKKSQENSSLVVKKHGPHRPNGVKDTSWRVGKGSADMLPLFAAFAAEKNGDGTKLTNGESWDKSALLSIQRELSEFSDYQNSLSGEHFSHVQNHLTFSGKEIGKKSSKDTSSSSGKSTKNKHIKSSKLRKLNSKNFFLHSEFSPFQSWVDLNKFPFGFGDIKILPNNGPPEWYDSPLYKELTSQRLHVPESNRGKKSENISASSPQHGPKHEAPQHTTQTLKTTSPKAKQYTELKKFEMHIKKTHQSHILQASSGSEHRCQSEGDFSAPWRKNRRRAKSTVPAGQPLISSPACDKSNAEEEGLLNKKGVRTMKEQTSNSTPFSILQLLTPAIPSRQETASSDTLQDVLSPIALDLPRLHDTEMCPSPEIKRESYKSMASSLLFNLKDNRKRVKARYSPPKFKGFDTKDQNKSLTEEATTKTNLEPPETLDAKTITPTHQKTLASPLSPLPEMIDLHTCPPSGHINGALPDDYLALSLLQAENRSPPNKPLKSNRSSLLKALYPSLHLYSKASLVDVDTKTFDVPGPHLTTDQTSKQEKSKAHAQEDCKELQRKHSTIKPEMHLNKPTENAETNKIAEKLLAENTDTDALNENNHHTVLKKKHSTRQDPLMILGNKNQDKLNMEGSVKDKECLRKEPKPKHAFSARQNNYIKSQRYVSADDEEYLCNGGKIDPAEGEVSRDCNVTSRNTEHTNVREGMRFDKNVTVHSAKEQMQGKLDGAFSGENIKNCDSITKDCVQPSKDDLGICTDRRTKNDALFMKGNTSAKRAMFTFKEQVSTKTGLASKKESVGLDKYELASAALEEVIAEREERKKRYDFTCADGDYKQETISLSQKDVFGKVTKGRSSQRDTSGFKPSSQMVQSMSDRETTHGKSHVAEVNLAGPRKQKGATGQSQHAAEQIKHTEKDRSGRPDQQSDTDHVKPMDRIDEFKEKEPVVKNSSVEESSRGTSTENKLTREDKEPSAQSMSSSCKPEVPPRRGKESSQSEDKEMYKKYRPENVGGRLDSSFVVKNEKLISGDKKAKLNLPTDRGHMSALKENFDREQRVQNIIGEGCLSEGEGPGDYHEMDPEKLKVPEVTESTPEGELVSRKHNHDGTGMDLDIKKLHDVDFKLASREEEDSRRRCDKTIDIQTLTADVTTRNESETGINQMESEYATNLVKEYDDNQSKSKDNRKSPPNRISEKSIVEKVKSEKIVTNQTLETLESIQTNNTIMNNVTDNSPQSEPSSAVDVKQLKQSSPLSYSSKEFPFTIKTDQSLSQHENNLSNQTRNCEENSKQIIDSHSFSNPEGELGISGRLISPPTDGDKGGWVRCLIESATNLTPPCQSNVSSPIMGKPALFKVKDNTFSASPVTKAVRPILHKTLTQPWSPRESLSESDRGDEELFKDCVEVQSPTVLSPALPSTPVRSPRCSQSSALLLSSPASQFSTSTEKKGLPDRLTVPEDDEWRSAISSVSEGMESSGTSAVDTVEEIMSRIAPREDMGGSKEPSERSESVCSVGETQFQSKPPAVPPKTEQALRRAMKLTTRRIQKAEAKSKPERTGRSSEKNANRKLERRHHSSDKALSDKSDHRGREHERCGENSRDSLVPKTHQIERHGRPHSNQQSHNREKDGSRKLQRENHGNLTSNHGEDTLKGQFDMTNVNACCERPGRNSQKYLPEKLGRRAHSLDRFSCNKHERMLLSTEGVVSKTNTETSEKHFAANRANLRQNSTDCTYVSPAANIVTQSFPMSQRKVLQDPDSGQYFVVDMPLQVRTKTFFDPETGSYVQLPVQSPEALVPKAQSVEVVNAPTFVLLHGFLPVPVSTLPPQQPTISHDSLVSFGDAVAFESSELDKHEDVYRKQMREEEHYTEPVCISQEHLDERIDSLR